MLAKSTRCQVSETKCFLRFNFTLLHGYDCFVGWRDRFGEQMHLKGWQKKIKNGWGIPCFGHNSGFTIKFGKDFNHIVQVSQLLRCNTKVLAFLFCGAETKVEVQV